MRCSQRFSSRSRARARVRLSLYGCGLTLSLTVLALVACEPLPEAGPVSPSSLTPTPSQSVSASPASSPAGATPPVAGSHDREHRVVVKVIDGDTIDVAPQGGTARTRIRLIGVDTPETKDPRKPVQCFGKEASNFTGQLVGRTVWLEYDVEKTDRYGRVLAYVFLDDGAFFNLILVEEGYAQPMTIPPNVRYADRFVEASRNAREAGRGLWSACR